MKRVLIIAYHFPPSGTGGVARALGWTRHLGPHGWQPTVLAASPPPNWPRDESLLSEIPAAVQVERVSARDPRPSARRGIERRELSFLWRTPALLAARRLLRATPHNVILATAPPPVAHALADTLSHDFGIPWVADFRDPWGVRAPAFWRRWRRRKYVRSAVAVVAVNDTLRQHLESAFGRAVTTIFNGYEPDDIPAGVERVPRRAVYLGTISEFNDLDSFFAAVADVDGEFLHIGASRHYDVAARARANGLAKASSTGYLDRREALRLAATASVYVLSLKPDLELAVSAKTFEYIGLGGPILCIGDHGAMAEFVRGIEGPRAVVPAGDRNAIRTALAQLWQNQAGVNEAYRQQFTRGNLAAKMAVLLDSVVENQ